MSLKMNGNKVKAEMKTTTTVIIIMHRKLGLPDIRAACIAFLLPPPLFSGNLMADFFFSSYLLQRFQRKSRFSECGGVFISLSPVGLLKQVVSMDLLGFTAFRNLYLFGVTIPLVTIKDYQRLRNSLGQKTIPAFQREDPSSVVRIAKLKTSYPDFEVLTFSISGNFSVLSL